MTPTADLPALSPRQRSNDLQTELLTVLANPTQGWPLEPLIVCHALQQVLQAVMTAVVELDASRLPYCVTLLEQTRQHAAAAAAIPKVSH